MHFWYSKLEVKVFLFLLLCAVIGIATLVPPMQSPDEPAHLNRAYLLSKGHIFLEGENGVTGGSIDQGLLQYENSFEYLFHHPEKKISAPVLQSSKEIKWAKQEYFAGLPNTAAYFPLSYVPQAIGFGFGQLFKLSVNDSYYLCRVCSLLASLVVLYFAFMLYPVPPIVLACFMLPMTLFQMGAASLDSFSFALVTLGSALFVRGLDKHYSFNRAHLGVMCICFLAIATSRINFIALTLLPLAIYSYRKIRLAVWLSASSLFAALGWTIFTLATNKGLTNWRPISTAEALHFYLVHPFDFLQIFGATLTNWHLLKSYWVMFVGDLGWLDTPPSLLIIRYCLAVFIVLGALTFQTRYLRIKDTFRIWMALILLGTFICLFAILLAAWSPFPAQLIEGIQGRYFTPFVILLAYGFFDIDLPPSKIMAVRLILGSFLVVTLVTTSQTLLSRYWLS